MPDNVMVGRVEVLYGHSVTREKPRASIGPAAANSVTAPLLERFLLGRSTWRALCWHDLLHRPFDRWIGSERAFLLTFDDGYRDNLTEALPILERLGIPVLLFVTTGFIDGTIASVEHVLARIIANAAVLRLPKGHQLPCQSMADKRAAYDALKPALKRKRPTGRRRLLDILSTLNGTDNSLAESAFLTWDDVRRLDRHPLVTIGAHTRSHPLLTTLGPLEMHAEVRRCKAELESKLGHPVDCFAYPYGGHNLLVRYLVGQAGFRLAFATGQRPLPTNLESHLLRIPRIDLKKAIVDEIGVAT